LKVSGNVKIAVKCFEISGGGKCSKCPPLVARLNHMPQKRVVSPPVYILSFRVPGVDDHCPEHAARSCLTLFCISAHREQCLKRIPNCLEVEWFFLH